MDIDRSVLEEACERLGVRLLVLFGSHVPGGLPPEKKVARVGERLRAAT
jgi:hypothetical protein